MSKTIDWPEFYTEFADKLLDYKNKRGEMIAKIQSVYKAINMTLPRFEQYEPPKDLDPFTVFGTFNKGITEANKHKIMAQYKTEFGIAAEVPLNCIGVPLLNNINANFQYFEGYRGVNDIENLWTMFAAAIKLADHDTPENRNAFAEIYDQVATQKGIRWNITMGFFWIRPGYYINLDSRNRWFMAEPSNIGTETARIIKKMKDLPNGSDYLSICDRCRDALATGKYAYKSFPELSGEAWNQSEKVNQERKTHNVSSPETPTGAALADEDVEQTHYWTYSPGNNAEKFNIFCNEGIMAIGWGYLGDLQQFSSKEEIRNALKASNEDDLSYKIAAHTLWEFSHEMKPGDIIIAKKGRSTIIGKGIVESEYIYVAERPDEFQHVRRVKWTDQGEWPYPDKLAPMKTLTDITAFTDTIEKIKALFVSEAADGAIPEEIEINYPPYSPEKFLEDVYMDEESYETLVGLVRKKKNVILQGAPGVGKTFAAKRLAYSMMGEKDPNRVMMIQFHQSYSYEDFIMGFRPSGAGFELKRGAFYNFCKAAEIDSDNEYFFIIDEINRGNLSKIFGELFMLIENDKRGIELQLLYSDEKFSVPANVYIIGMMNTADRSLAMLDYALRRRFAFFDLKPGFFSDGFRAYRNELDSAKFDNLIRCIENLNAVIAADESLGSGFCIGHSYFCNLKTVTDQALKGIIEYEIIPLLKEYWFDEPMKVEDWSANLRNAIK